jgi:hypothetical protein
MRPQMLSLALAAAVLSVPAAARAQFGYADTDCSGLKLQRASGVPKSERHWYSFSGSCKLQYHQEDEVTDVHTFPAEATVTWLAKDKSLVEQFTTLGGFEYQGKVVGGQVYNAFVCDDDPMINPQAACSGVEHWNHTAMDGLSSPYQHFRPITKGRTTLAEATKLSGPSGQMTTAVEPPAPKPNGPKMLSSPKKAGEPTGGQPPKMLSSPKGKNAGPTMLSSPKGTLVIEGEQLVASAQKSEGQVIAQDMAPFGTTWSNGAQLAWSASQPGAQLRLAPVVGTAGRYEVAIVFTMAPDYARIKVSVDGVEPVAFDGYAPSVISARQVIGTFDFTRGPHEILLAVTGRDPRSTGFLTGIDRLELTRQP